MKLTVEEKSTLIALAREAIRLVMSGSGPEDSPAKQLTAGLKGKSGAFVSIYKGQALRGSMGLILPILPLWQAVRDSAIYAAFRDHRFSPLTPDELDDVTLEVVVPVSRTSPIEASDIRSGSRGIILRKGFRQAALLPHDPEIRMRGDRRLEAYPGREPWLDPEERDRADVLEIFSAVVFTGIMS